MPGARVVSRRVCGLLGLGSAVALALIPGIELWRFAVASQALPQWDMAKYGVSSLRLADAARQLDVVGWLVEIHGFSTWPPTWPLLESMVFLAFGDGFGVARGLVVVTWMLSVLAAWWALRPLPGGDAAGLLAAAWLAQSPLLQALATVHLLEVPGTFLLLVCLGCALRALGGSAARTQGRWWRATWLCSLLLFFLKYNYGLLWLAPLLLAELVRRRGGWRKLASWAWSSASRFRWTPWRGLVAVYVALLAAIRLSGGVDTEIFGQQIRATSIGNPAYGLLLLVCLRTLFGGREACRQVRSRWRRLEASWHGVASLLIAPIFVWMLLPPHVKEFFGFVENRSSGLGLVESLAFYPRVVVNQYAATAGLGLLVLALAAAGLVWLASADGRLRLVALITLTAWLAVLAHPYKLPRFGAQAAMLAGLLGAAWLASQFEHRRSVAPVWISALALAAVGGALWSGVDRTFVETQHEMRTVPAETAPFADAAAKVATNGGVVLGTWNELSPALVEWLARRDALLDAAWRPTTTFDLTRRSDPQAVLRALAETPCRPVALVTSESTGWRAENAWLDDVIVQLRSDPCRRANVFHRNLTVFECPPGEDAGACRSR